MVLPKEVEERLAIERFVNQVTEALYTDKADAVGLASDRDRVVLTKFLASEYEALEQKLYKTDTCTYTYG